MYLLNSQPLHAHSLLHLNMSTFVCNKVSHKNAVLCILEVSLTTLGQLLFNPNGDNAQGIARSKQDVII